MTLPLLLGGASCASYGSHVTATPLRPGGTELSLNADALVIDRGFGPQVLPNPELGLRWGLSPNLDLGGRLNAGGVETNLRWRFLHAPGCDVALLGGTGFGFVPATNQDSGVFNANLLGAALGSLAFGEQSQGVLGLRAVATYAFPPSAFRGEASGARMLYMPGGVLGVRFPVGGATYLFPDVSVLVPYDSLRQSWGFPTIQAGIALQFVRETSR